MPKKLLRRVSLLLVIIILAAGAFMYTRPIKALQPAVSNYQPIMSKPVNLPWPGYGQAAIGASGMGLLQTYGAQTPVPIASITKVITSLAILEKYPIVTGQQGATITLSDNDVNIYNDYVTKDGSVAKVEAGEQLTEYQALQAMMLPSANNVADSLAIWAFGSIEAYTDYANQMLTRLGLNQTHVADASGFSPQSVSNATDLVKIGELALKNPILAEIVAQPQAVLPVAGNVQNVNFLLGTDNIVGIKTGNTDQAGGCYLFAVDVSVGKQNVTMIGSVLEASNLYQSMIDSDSLIKVAKQNFDSANLITKDSAVGTYHSSWGTDVEAVAAQDISAVVWKGQKPIISTKLNNVDGPAPAGKKVGTLTITLGDKEYTSDVVLQKPVSKPPLLWRIFRH